MQPTAYYERIIALLDTAGIPYEKLEHGHVHTSHDAAKVRGTKIEEAAKALILQTKSGNVFQCVVSGHRRLDLKKVKLLVGEKNVSLAHPDVVSDRTGCPVGTVPPFGNLFKPPMLIYADQEIFTREYIVFSAGSYYHSIRMRAEDWQALTQAKIVDIGTQTYNNTRPASTA